jgi:GT2 family glycosyltransferase
VKTDLVTFGFLHPGEVATQFSHSMLGAFMCDVTGKQRMVSHRLGKIAKECHAARIAEGRNELMVDFLESSATWLFQIDADMGFAPDTIERLIASADQYRRPVMGGLCFGLKSDGASSFGGQRFRCQPTVFHMHETDDRVGWVPDFNYPRDRVVEVDGTGAACMLIHRRALEKVADEYGPEWYTPIRLRGDKVANFSEDLSFCVRLRAVDVPIHVDTRVKTTHCKGGVYLDEEYFDLQQSVRALLPVGGDPL